MYEKFYEKYKELLMISSSSASLIAFIVLIFKETDPDFTTFHIFGATAFAGWIIISLSALLFYMENYFIKVLNSYDILRKAMGLIYSIVLIIAFIIIGYIGYYIFYVGVSKLYIYLDTL